MKAGTVASIRVNPRDCQSILDVLDAAELPRASLSWAQCVSLALGCLLETARNSGVIPEPDEFEYLNRMAPYIGPKRLPKTGKMARKLQTLGGDLRAPSLPELATAPPAAAQVSGDDPPAPPAAEVDPDSEDYKVAQKRLTILLIRKEQAEDDPNVVWTAEDEREFQKHYAVIYPNG